MMTLILTIGLACFPSATHGANRYHLHDFAINASAMSITSFAFRGHGGAPAWVEHIIGSRAVYWNLTDGRVMHYQDIPQARKNFRIDNEQLLPKVSRRPLCSIEMLGFARLGMAAPFRGLADRFLRPSTGTARLAMMLGSKNSGAAADTITDTTADASTVTELSVECYYRALYLNYKNADPDNSFWATVFYCPSSAMSEVSFCSAFTDAHKPKTLSTTTTATTTTSAAAAADDVASYPIVQFRLQVRVAQPTSLDFDRSEQVKEWIVEFGTQLEASDPYAFPPRDTPVVDPDPMSRQQHHPQHHLHHQQLQRQQPQQQQQQQQLAICTVWPYSTANPSKVAANEAITYEFIRYYSNLGIKIFAYDRGGVNMGRVFSSAYARANPQRGAYQHAVERNLVYFDYSIHSLLLDSQTEEVRSDNEATTQSLVWLLDHDKELTYTQCRFEAKARFGITKVLVADFDEFLYCKGGGSSVQGQKRFLRQYLEQVQREGIEQIMFGQTWVASRAISRESLDAAGLVPSSSSSSSSLAKATSSSAAGAESEEHEIDVEGSGASAETGTGTGGSSTVHDCVNQEVQRTQTGSYGSVFNCFSSTRHLSYIPFVKSVHLSHSCPYTSMHHACGGCFGSPHHVCTKAEQNMRVYDCICNAETSKVCHFVHLSMVETNYYGHMKSDLRKVLAATSELWNISNAVD